jgi:hypothetical protein
LIRRVPDFEAFSQIPEDIDDAAAVNKGSTGCMAFAFHG